MFVKRLPLFLNIVLLLIVKNHGLSLNTNFTKIGTGLKGIAVTLESYADYLKKISTKPDETDAERLPRNCYEVLKQGKATSGVYAVQTSDSSQAFTVKCDMDVMGGGWTYVLDRFDGSQDFFLNYTIYRRGFGGLNKEFWLGLENLYQLTGYSGTAGDSLKGHLNAKFTAQDYDQDNDPKQNCATYYRGAWWYDNCYTSQLTGLYSSGTTSFGMVWWGFNYSLKRECWYGRATELELKLYLK